MFNSNSNEFSIFIDGLPHNMNSIWLTNLFKSKGEIVDVYISFKKRDFTENTFGFVRFRYEEHAKSAIESLNGKIVEGNPISVKWAKKRSSSEFSSLKGHSKECSITNTFVEHLTSFKRELLSTFKEAFLYHHKSMHKLFDKFSKEFHENLRKVENADTVNTDARLVNVNRRVEVGFQGDNDHVCVADEYCHNNNSKKSLDKDTLREVEASNHNADVLEKFHGTIDLGDDEAFEVLADSVINKVASNLIKNFADKVLEEDDVGVSESTMDKEAKVLNDGNGGLKLTEVPETEVLIEKFADTVLIEEAAGEVVMTDGDGIVEVDAADGDMMAAGSRAEVEAGGEAEAAYANGDDNGALKVGKVMGVSEMVAEVVDDDHVDDDDDVECMNENQAVDIITVGLHDVIGKLSNFKNQLVTVGHDYVSACSNSIKNVEVLPVSDAHVKIKEFNPVFRHLGITQKKSSDKTSFESDKCLSKNQKGVVHKKRMAQLNPVFKHLGIVS